MMSSRTFNLRSQQRGIAAVMAVIILITAVIFVLSQSRLITGSNSLDNKQQMDSTAALFAAESGLERARSILPSKLDITDPATCNATTTAQTTVGSGSGSGSFTLVATPLPLNCTSATCTSCQVVSTGTVGNANRAITQTFRLLKAAYCNAATTPDCHNQTANPLATPPVPPRWALNLDPYPSASTVGIGVFNTAANYYAGLFGTPYYPATNINQWNISSGSSILGMGNTVNQVVAATRVFQRLNANVDVVETGARFPFAATGASVVGAYSDTVSSAGNSTIGGTGVSQGKTTDGTQTASSWCYGGNTLVMGFSAHSSSAKSDHLTNVVFNTIPLTNIDSAANVMKSPTSADTAAANDVYSEIWYKSNPAYTYGKWITGKITVTPLTLDIQPTNNQKYGVLKSAVTGIVGVGDTIDQSSCASRAIPAGATVTGFDNNPNATSCSITSGSFNGRPINTLLCFSINALNGGNCHNGVISGSDVRLEVITVNGGISDLISLDPFQGQGQTVGGLAGMPANLSISSRLTPTDSGFIGTYRLSATTPLVNTPQAMVVGGATVTANTVTLSNISPSVITLPTQGTVLAVRTVPGMTTAQNGLLASNPYTTNGTNPLTLWSTATTNSLPNGAVLCGGTCAFFAPTPGSTTAFGFDNSSTPGTDNWAAGFTCLNNVGAPTALSGSGSALNGAVWQEQPR